MSFFFVNFILSVNNTRLVDDNFFNAVYFTPMTKKKKVGGQIDFRVEILSCLYTRRGKKQEMERHSCAAFSAAARQPRQLFRLSHS